MYLEDLLQVNPVTGLGCAIKMEEKDKLEAREPEEAVRM